MAHQNSIAAHRGNRYGERCRAIMEAIKKGPGTDRDIMHRLGKVDPNSVRPRVTELVKVGALEEVGTQIDAETGKTVRVVDLPRSELFKACAAMASVQAKQLTLGF